MILLHYDVTIYNWLAVNTYEHTGCFSAACKDAGVCNVDTDVHVVCKKKKHYFSKLA